MKHFSWRKRLALIFFILAALQWIGFSQAQAATIPTINVGLGEAQNASEVGQSLSVLILLTVLTLAPSILVLMTSFTRIVIVLGFARNAMGTQNMPPNQVVVGLSLILTLFIMSPIISDVYHNTWLEYSAGNITLEQAAAQAEAPLKEFMLKQTRHDDLDLFIALGDQEIASYEEIPFHYALPAFIISELKTAFQMGFMIYVPFLIIDMVVASTLMSMGMMMLPPVMISLPFKVLLFVLVDGWHLVVDAILRSFIL